MTRIRLVASHILDHIAHTMVSAPDGGMASASLLRWYAKAATFAREPLSMITDDLLVYASEGTPPERLVSLASDFPAMFSWFGRDIIRSDTAQALLGQIHRLLREASEVSFCPYQFCESAERQLQDYRVLPFVENLLGLRGHFAELRLVVFRDLWDPFFVLPNTVVCLQDDTLSAYVAMIAHETTHILTLALVNDPVITADVPREITQPMAEALAQAVQMLTTEKFGIPYEALFPGRLITDHESYLRSHPQRARMAPMIVRLMERLRAPNGTLLREIYRSALEEACGSGRHGSSAG